MHILNIQCLEMFYAMKPENTASFRAGGLLYKSPA